MRGEAVVGAVEPALAEVAVADRRAGDFARQPQQEGLVDRAGDRVGVEPPVPAAQPLERAHLALPGGAQPAEPPRRLQAGDREVVGLHRLEALEVVLVAGAQQFLDPPRPEAVEPVAGDVVRVVVADDAVVGGDEEAALGVDDLGQLVVGDRPLPLELALPARLRQVGAAALAQRQAADQLVADRAVAVGPDQVGGGRGMALQGGDQLGAGADPVQLEHPLEGGRLVEGDPAQGKRLGVVGAERRVDERAVVGDADVEHLGRVAALDGDLLAHDLERPPLVLEQVAVALDPLDEEVLDVGHHVGEGPADVVVLAHVDAGHARQRGAADEAVAEREADLVPDARHALRQVGVAGDQRRAGCAQRAADRPVVGAARLGGHADRAAHRVDLLGEAEAVARPRFLGDDRVVRRVARVELGRQLGAELAGHVGAQQLLLPVGREAEGEQLAEAEDVGRAPRLELEPQQLHLERQRLGARRRRVDALAEALEQGEQLRVEARRLALCRAPHPQRAHQPVDRQPLGAGELGDATGEGAAVEVHLPEPVLAVAEALGEPEVGRAPRLDVRNAPAVAPHPHRPFQPGKLDRALLLGQRPPRQPVPGGGSRGCSQAGADGPSHDSRPCCLPAIHPSHNTGWLARIGHTARRHLQTDKRSISGKHGGTFAIRRVEGAA